MEISVGNSKQDPPVFKELILSTSFMTEKEVRNDQQPHRIRFFEKSSMVESVANEQHDLIKIKCTQPYTNRWQYGISFITIYTSEEVDEIKVERSLPVSTPKSSKKEVKIEPPKYSLPSSSKKSPKKMIGKFAFRDSSSSEDENHEASPYKQWKMKQDATKNTEKDTRKRIRSTSDSPDDQKVTKPKAKHNRNRVKGLMYDSDDDAPNERLQKKIDIDQKKEKEKEKEKEKKVPEKSNKSPTSKFASFLFNNDPTPSSSSPSQIINKSSSSKQPVKKEAKSKPFNKLLEDVTFVMSGYQNPERATLRQKALDMGARYKADWDDSCSHLMYVLYADILQKTFLMFNL